MMRQQESSDRPVTLVHIGNAPEALACFLDGQLVLSTGDGASSDVVKVTAERLSMLRGVQVHRAQHWVPGPDWSWNSVRDYLRECGELPGGTDLPQAIAKLHEYDPRGSHPAFPPVAFHASGKGLGYWEWVSEEWSRLRVLMESRGYRVEKDSGDSYRFVSPEGARSRASYPTLVAAWDPLMVEARNL